MSLASLVSISIANIGGDCLVSNGCCDLDRLDLVGYCVKRNSGKCNKCIINMIKGNDNNMYNVCNVEGIISYILWQEAAFLAHLQPK